MKCAFQERCCKGPRITYLWQGGFYRLQQTAEAEYWPVLHWPGGSSKAPCWDTSLGASRLALPLSLWDAVGLPGAHWPHRQLALPPTCASYPTRAGSPKGLLAPPLSHLPDVLRHCVVTWEPGKMCNTSRPPRPVVPNVPVCPPRQPRLPFPCARSALLCCLSSEPLKIKPKRPWTDLWGWESPCQSLRQHLSRLGVWASEWRDD